MISLVHWLMVVLFVGWGAFFIFVLVRFRKKAQPRGRLRRARRASSRRGSRSRSSSRKWSCWCSTPSRPGRTRVRDFPAENEATVVRVVAEQFAWNVHYPGPDGKFGRTDIKPRRGRQSARPRSHRTRTPRTTSRPSTSSTLPVDRPVLVHLSSKDVIHSFGLFEMRVKQDAVPGLDIPVWFIPNQHRRLRDRLLAAVRPRPLPDARLLSVKTDADYKAWLAEEAKALAK